MFSQGARETSGTSAGYPKLSPSDKLLCSAILLPRNPCIAFTVYTPGSNSQKDPECLELARRHILAINGAKSILDSLLYSVVIGKDGCMLYLFAIGSHDTIGDVQTMLSGLHLPGLYLSESSSFTPQDLYPCSAQCSVLRVPCATCLDPNTPRASTSQACHLPREPLRAVYTRFHDAIRDRLIEDISQAAARQSGARPAHRLKGGFLLGISPISTEWGKGWEYHAMSRPLAYCHLDIHLSQSRITIHPVLRPTHFLPFAVTAPSQGTAITLLPHATPAYFLASYTGPTTALNLQFTQSLAGLGVGEWDGEYVIAWVNVQNKQGEDKGLTVIWPARLCLAFAPTHIVPRLHHIPDLPAQLQPSPPPPAPLQPAYVQRRACTSPSRESVLAFKALTLSRSNDIHRSAAQASDYVDGVARERETERERIRRERDGPPRPSLFVQPEPSSSLEPRSIQKSRFSSSTSSSDPPPHSATSSSSAFPSLASFPHSQPLYGSQHSHPRHPAYDSTLPPPIPTQQFYPSPPQTNGQPPPPPAEKALSLSEEDEDGQSPLFEPTPPPSHEEEPTQSVNLALPEQAHPMVPSPSYAVDPWGQPPGNDFMKMDFDLGFGMDMDSGPSGSAGAGGGGGAVPYTRVLDDAFTDDDFSFFDDPPPTSNTLGFIHPPPPTQPVSIPSSPAFVGGEETPVLSPWVSTTAVEAAGMEATAPNAAAIPPTPPLSYMGPLTPIVQLSDPTHTPFSNVFHPIPFAPSHRMADGKYARGKFCLPSPPDEADRTEALSLLSSSVPYLSSPGWKRQYNAETDFRVGVVRKLIGVKRKSFDQGSRKLVKLPPVWMREHEDWGSSSSNAASPASEEPDSEDEFEDNDTPLTSRPNTPVPAYLPMGPLLLHTHFRHSQLLPLCSPLRPPGAAVAPTSMSTAPAPTSVPTPVSPAMMGAAQEQTKSLEAAAFTLAKEVVENSVWAEAWTANAVGLKCASMETEETNQMDTIAVKEILEGIPAVQGPLDLTAVFDIGSSSLKPLEPPLLSVAKSNAIVQVLPTALRFWDKLGLGPRGGRKNVTAFVMFEEGGPGREFQAETWLAGVSSTWSAKQFGMHVVGKSPACTRNGVVPIRFASFRKSLSGFISSLSTSDSSVVVHLITPAEVMRLASPILRQIFSALKRATQSSKDVQFHFQLAPEHVVFSDNIPSAALDQVVTSVYNRLHQRVERAMSRQLFQFGQEARVFVQEPAFTLSRPLYSKVKYLKQVPVRSLDVVDRHTLLHVGYQISPCGKWILAACVDQRGESNDIGVWLNHGDTPFVSQIWKFVVQFAKKANIEWRIVITRLGAIPSGELSAWITYFADTMPGCRELPIFHVSLLVAEDISPLSFVKRHPSERKTATPSKDPTSGFFYMDAVASIYAIPFALSMPVPLMRQFQHLGEGTFIAEDEEGVSTSDEIGLLPTASIALLRLPHDLTSTTSLSVHLLHVTSSSHSALVASPKETHQDIVRNFQELVVLNETRWKIRASNPLLPFHLAAVDVMQRALDLGISGGD